MVVHLKYEMPADQSETAQERRASFGEKYYEKYATKEAPEEKPEAKPEVEDEPVATPGEEVYTVVKGDTLSAIAKKYGTTYQKLAKYNGIGNPNRITVGQKIKIPSVTVYKVYTVVKGDTLSAIAKKYGMDYKKIAEYNKIANPNRIYVGQQIRIPN